LGCSALAFGCSEPALSCAELALGCSGAAACSCQPEQQPVVTRIAKAKSACATAFLIRASP
jgi:hypothetical protein